MAKGPLHAVRGSGEQEKMLKNAKTEYFNEHEEIATYLAIETLAERVKDSETAKLARAIRREEERMAQVPPGSDQVADRRGRAGGDPGLPASRHHRRAETESEKSVETTGREKVGRRKRNGRKPKKTGRKKTAKKAAAKR